MELFWEEAVAVAKSATLVSTLTGVPTVMVTREGLLTSVLFATTREKINVSDSDGAVNVGLIEVTLDSVTSGPAVWVHK